MNVSSRTRHVLLAKPHRPGSHDPSYPPTTSLLFGRITVNDPLVLISEMSENGVIFSDGIEQDFLEFRSGTRATLGIAEKRGCLVI